MALPKVGVQNVILYTRIAERKKMISYFSDYTLVFGRTKKIPYIFEMLESQAPSSLPWRGS